MSDNAKEVPLVEQLRSVPKDWREWREVEHESRNVPYGVMMHQAADEIDALRAEVQESHLREIATTGQLQDMIKENASLRRSLRWLAVAVVCFIAAFLSSLASRNPAPSIFAPINPPSAAHGGVK